MVNPAKLAQGVGGVSKVTIAEDVASRYIATSKSGVARNEAIFNPDIVDKAEYVVAKGVDGAIEIAQKGLETIYNPVGAVVGDAINPQLAMLAPMAVMPVFNKATQTTNYLASKTSNYTVKTVAESVNKANASVNGFLKDNLGNTLGKTRVGSAIGSGFTKASNVMAGGLEKVGLEKAGSAFRAMPQGIAAQTTVQGVFSGAMVVGAGLQMASGGTGFFRNLNRLKKMASEITGKKVSTWAILTGNVPEVIKTERNALLQNFGVAEGTGGLSMWVAVRMALGAFSWPLMIGTTVASMVASMFFGKESSVGTYKEINKLYNSGQPVPAEAYATLLGSASPEIIKRGSGNAFAVALGEQYAQEQLSPAMVMREIEQGLDKVRIQNIITANEAKKAAPQVAVASQQSVQPVQEFTVNRINGRVDPATVNKPIIGQHTAALAGRQQQAPQMAMRPRNA